MAADDALPWTVAIYGKNAKTRQIEEAGISHATYWVLEQLALNYDTAPILRVNNIEDDDDYRSTSSSNDDEEEEDALFDEDDEAYHNYLMSLNPIETKEQDHYRVLGLSKLRHAASDAAIRKAYRQKIVTHHPDKRRARGVAVKNDKDDYFVCITRAYEQLSVKSKRIAYDSIDPEFNDDVPSQLDVKNSQDFYALFTPVFTRNARWSRKKPVPELGDAESSHDHVQKFYSFWFDFESWREFSYLDEEDSDKGENRYERRFLERENKAKRQERRKDELRRLRNLVEVAYANDPRVIAYKQQEKSRKEEMKQAKKDAQRQKKLKQEQEEQALLEQERIAREKKMEEEKERIQLEKKAREAMKKELKHERKKLKELVEKSNYFCSNADNNATERHHRADGLLRLCEVLDRLELRDFNTELSSADEVNTQCKIFDDKLSEIDKKLDARTDKSNSSKPIMNGHTKSNSGNVLSQWTEEETKLMVKAFKLFPVGTKQRWEVIAQFINEHQHCKKTAKDVIAHTKLFQNMDASKVPINKDNLEGCKRNVTVEATGGLSMRTDVDTVHDPWTVDEQKLLEQALKTYPPEVEDRWVKIAECLPNRTKKECIRRFKDLAELVKAKRAAQQKVAKSTK